MEKLLREKKVDRALSDLNSNPSSTSDSLWDFVMKLKVCVAQLVDNLEKLTKLDVAFWF